MTYHVSAGHINARSKNECRVTLFVKGEAPVITEEERKVEIKFTCDDEEREQRFHSIILQFIDFYGLKMSTYDFDVHTIQVRDVGAPDWVLAARLEAAFYLLLSKSSFDTSLIRNYNEPFLPYLGDTLAVFKRGNQYRPFVHPRSRLYVPGSSPRFIIKCFEEDTGTDMITFDLEDGVAEGVEHKLSARILTRNALHYLDFGKVQTSVRINTGALGLEDLKAIVGHTPVRCVVVPKVEDKQAIIALETAILSTKRSFNWIGYPLIMPLFESALGIENSYKILKALKLSRGNVGDMAGAALGLEDYTADIGASKTVEGLESRWACQRVVNAAAAVGTVAYDSVFGNFRDKAALLEVTAAGKALGFAGKSCIHPSQAKPVNEVYSPTEDEVARARRIVESHEQGGAVGLDGMMVDEPVVRRARGVLQRAERE